MKKTKIGIAFGVLVLAVGAFAVTKANSKKASLGTTIYANGVGYIATGMTGHPHLTLTKGVNHTAFIVTGTNLTKHLLLSSQGPTQEWYVY